MFHSHTLLCSSGTEIFPVVARCFMNRIRWNKLFAHDFPGTRFSVPNPGYRATKTRAVTKATARHVYT